jgi:hypothetical protein
MPGPAERALIELDEAAHRMKLRLAQESSTLAITLAYDEPSRETLFLSG